MAAKILFREGGFAVRFAGLIALCLLAACGNQQTAALPTELELSGKVFSVSDTHLFGPGGINEAFMIYELGDEIVSDIKTGGLNYLDSLPSSVRFEQANGPPANLSDNQSTPPWANAFTAWQQGPVAMTDDWYRGPGHPVPLPDNPLIGFFRDTAFVQEIPVKHQSPLRKALASADTVYSYGGYRGQTVLILDPLEAKAYYLYRD